MQLNQPKDAYITKLVVDGQEIAVVDDFKYLGSNVGSTNSTLYPNHSSLDCIREAQAITKSIKTFKFNIRLLNAVCKSIMLMDANLGFSKSHSRRR